MRMRNVKLKKHRSNIESAASEEEVCTIVRLTLQKKDIFKQQ